MLFNLCSKKEKHMTEKTQIINKRLDQILYGTEWTHKIHEKVADTFEITDRLLTFISVLTTAFSGSGILAAVFSNNQSLRIAAAILAAISLFSPRAFVSPYAQQSNAMLLENFYRFANVSKTYKSKSILTTFPSMKHSLKYFNFQTLILPHALRLLQQISLPNT